MLAKRSMSWSVTVNKAFFRSSFYFCKANESIDETHIHLCELVMRDVRFPEGFYFKCNHKALQALAPCREQSTMHSRSVRNFKVQT